MRTTPELRREQHYRRTVTVLQLVLGLLVLGLLTIATTSIFGGARFLLAPTPTLTATPATQHTPTPDFRARLVAEDRATQEAYNTLVAASNGQISPLGRPTIPAEAQPTRTLMLPIVVADNPVVTPTAIPAAVELTSVVLLPGIINSPPSDSILPTPTDLPPPGNESSGDNPEQPPADLPTETPTETPTEIPSPTPEPPTAVPPIDAATATPTPFLVSSLRAFVTVTPGATLYIGPSTQYTVTGSLNYNQEISLLYRDETGEWVAACCTNNVTYWLRQAYAPPRDNALQAGAPGGAEANDVRWLAVLAAPPTTEPILTPTAIPQDEFPFYRVRRGNNATWPALPKPPLQTDWPNPFPATGAMSSPILVTGGYVIAASDDNHIYKLDRTNGNQQRSFPVNQKITAGPVAQDGLLYFVTQSGTSYALNLELQQIWQSTVNGVPFTPLYQAGNRLYIGVQESDNIRRLMRIDRINSGTLFPERYEFKDPQPLAAMAVGNQLLYIGDPSLRAIDINKLTIVWQQDAIGRLTAPPVYVNNGTQALAELYVADDQNRLHLVDANTGRIIWSAGVGVRITGLAVGTDAIYASGPGFLLAWPRRNGNQLWRADVQGEARGGPIVGPNQILVATDIGTLRMFDLNGIGIDNAALPGGVQVPAGAAPAVSGLYIFVPGSDGKVHAFRGQP